MGIIIGFSRVTKKEIEALSKITDLKSRSLILRQADEIIDVDKAWEVLHFLLTTEKYPNEHIASTIMYPDSVTMELPYTEEEMETIYETGTPEEVDALMKEEELDVNYITSDEVISIFDFLRTVKIDELIKDCDFDQLNELGIYPKFWSEAEGHKEYVKENYDELFTFFERAKNNKNYVIVERG